MVDIKDSVVKSKINVGIACWGLVCGTTLALTAPRFKRRTMYLTTACSLLSVYIAWTISMERAMTTETKAAAVLTILFIFLYSPAYNLGYNALTYSMPLISLGKEPLLTVISISHRDLPVLQPIPRPLVVPVLRPWSHFLCDLCQSNWT